MITSAADYGLDLTVWDRDLRRSAPIPHFQSLDATVRHLAGGVLELVLDDDARGVPELQQPGARIVCRLDDQHFHSGPLGPRGGQVLPGGAVRYTFGDDFSMLTNALAWIVPDGPIAPATLDDPGQAVVTGPTRRGTVEGQSGEMAWPEPRMPVESAVKWFLGANLIGRMRRPVLIREDQGRGGTVQLPTVGRFASLEETVVPLLDAAGLGLRVWLSPDSPLINIDVYESQAYAPLIDAASGIILPGSTWERTPPTVTRVVVGGPGDGPERAFALYIDEELERTWGIVAEKFVSVTSAPQEYPKDLEDAQKIAKYLPLRDDVTDEARTAFDAAFDKAAADALAAGRPTAGVAARLMEVGSFYYGTKDGVRGFLRGDRVKIAAGDGDPIDDRITEVRLQVSGDGRVITPTVGNYIDDPERKTSDAIARLEAANAQREKSK